MNKVITSYTATQLTVNLSQDFRLRLLKPNKKQIDELTRTLSLNEAILDDDDDFISSGGQIPNNKMGVLKELKIFLSQNIVRISCMGAETSDCFDILYLAFDVLFGVKKELVDAGIDYTGYQTITKVRMNKPIYKIFNDKMQQQIREWQDLKSETVIKANSGESWASSQSGMIDISQSKFDRLYKGQENAIVIPSAVKFTIVVPTNYSRTSHYEISIQVQSVADFYENTYFISTELPYESHVSLIDIIEDISS